MGAFTADTAGIEALDYDFTGFVTPGTGEPCQGAGTIPEPSGDQLEEFTDFLEKLSKQYEDSQKDGAAPLDQKAMLEATIAATAKFCSGTPSEDQLRALPVRAFRGFFGWLQGQFAGPKVTP